MNKNLKINIVRKIVYSSFFITAFLLLASCSESPKREKTEIKFDALIYDDDGELFTGTKKGEVNGKIIEFDVVKGVKHGSFKIYGENNILEMEGEIKENKNDGLWKYYYPDGTMESEGNFENDLIEGKWSWYYPSGKLKETAEYNDGVRDGSLIVYDEEGSIIAERLFENGIEIKNDKNEL